MPPTLYVQLDNASDNKSRQILAFFAFLVEKKFFLKIKVSYLIVGHTHEDIDAFFSVLSRFFKRQIRQILSILGFVNAATSAFKTDKSKPKCTEQILCCFDTEPLASLVDPFFTRFDLDEMTGDKVHYFVFRCNSDGKAVVQYKLKRYSDALFPRKFDVGSEFVSEVHGSGIVESAEPYKDSTTKEKFWHYVVRFQDVAELVTVKLPASDTIPFFIQNSPSPSWSEQHFILADFKGTFEETLADQKAGVENIIRKLDLETTDPEDVQDWKRFWSETVDHVSALVVIPPFTLPPPQLQAQKQTAKRNVLDIDTGNREVQIVTHSTFTPSQRSKALKRMSQNVPRGMTALSKGMFVAVKFEVMNAAWYTLPFVIAQVKTDCTTIDLTDASTHIDIQIFMPTGHIAPGVDLLSKKFVPWQGDDGHLFCTTVNRGALQAINLELNKKSKTLTSKSLKLIKSATFMV